MSFQKTTYERAKAALDQGDARRLKRLIRNPVADDKGQRRAWLHDLVHRAARKGSLEAVTHLASLGGLRHRTLLATGWAVAAEHAQQDVVRGLEAMPGFPLDLRFRKACQERTWGAVRHLLEGGHVPTENDRRILFEKLAAEHPSQGDTDRLNRLLPLGDEAPKSALPDVLVVAMRVADEDVLVRTLGRAAPDDLFQAALPRLIEEARHHDHYDWANLMEKAAGRGLTGQHWGDTLLCQAVVLGRLRFVDDALTDRPDVLEYLQRGGNAAVAMGYQLVARQPDDPDENSERRVRLLHALFPHHRLNAVRNRIQTMASVGERDALLTRLALMAPDEVRERWFEQEPITFARAIATWRDAQPAPSLPNTRRPRQRV